jgi:hypothetical protein
MGRFLSRDIWKGDIYEPMSYNRWLYAYGDSINLTDPTGEFPESAYSFMAPSGKSLLSTYLVGIHKRYIKMLTECEEITVKEHYTINLSAYYMPVAKGGVHYEGEPIVKRLETKGRKPQKIYYDFRLNETKKRREALKTSGNLLYHPTEGICMQGTGKVEIEGGSPIYVYCLRGLSNPPEYTQFSASWGIYPEVEAFETAARAKNNSLFQDGEQVRIPILNELFRNKCLVSGHDDTVTVRSVGGKLSSNTLEIFVGAGQYSELKQCIQSIQNVDAADAYVYRKYDKPWPDNLNRR